MIGSTMDFSSAGDEELYTPVTAGRQLLLSRDRPEQTGHNEFKVYDGWSPGFFVTLSNSERICL